MDESMRIRILGDSVGAVAAFKSVEEAAGKTAGAITRSFERVGSIIKTSIGVVGFGLGLEKALDAASHLTNLQKVQAQLVDNQAKSTNGLLNLQKYQLEGSKTGVYWRSKYLDTMATQLSLQNGINKSQIVQAQTQSLTNSDLLKFYKEGGKYLGKNKDLMNLTLTDAANIAEVMGGGSGGSIVSSMRMMTRVMADPAKSLSTMRRMGIQLSQAENNRIKTLEKTKGLVAAQAEFLKDIDKHYHGIAATGQSPMEMLKNQVQLLYTALGQGLLPILDSLATSMSGPIQSLLPILQAMADAIKAVAEALGSSLGKIFADLTPLFQLMSNAIIPALLNIITPFVQMAEKAITPIANAFSKLVGTGTKLGPLAKVIISIGENVSKNLQPAIKLVSQTFNDMSKGGKNSPMSQMMNSILDAVNKLAPILPSLATAFTDILYAIMPIITAAGPDFAKLISLFASILQVLNPLIQAFGAVILKLAPFIQKLAGPIAMLLAVWFTRKMFITPVMGAIGMVQKLAGAIGGVGRSWKTAQAAGEGTGKWLGKGFWNKFLGNPKKPIEVAVKPKLEPFKGGAVPGYEALSKNLANRPEAVLKDLAPAYQKAAEIEAKSAARASMFGKLRSGASGLFGKIGGLRGIGGAVGMGGMALGAAQAAGLIPAPGKGVGGAIGSVAEGAALGMNFGPWGAAIGAAAGGIKALYDNCKPVHKFVNEVGSKLKEWGQKIMPVIVGVAKKLAPIFGFIGHIIADYISKSIQTIKKEIQIVVGIVKGLWHAFKWVGHIIGWVYDHTVRPFVDAIKKVFNFVGSIWHGITGFFGGGGGNPAPPNRAGKPKAYHSGGIVPGPMGREVPAVLQAGEAVLSLRQLNALTRGGRGNTLNVHDGAVVINVHGNADHATTQEIKRHVDAQFKELHRNLKALGR